MMKEIAANILGHSRAIKIVAPGWRHGVFQMVNLFDILVLDGCKYEGQYINGYFHGRGNFVAPDGRSYNGDFLNGKQCGNGVVIMISRDQLGDKERLHIGKHGTLYRAIKYIGNWDQEVRHGFGKLIYLNRLEIEGVFKNGHLHKEANRRYDTDKYELIPDDKKHDETGI